MPTNNSWNNNVAAANVSFTGGTMAIGTDATANAINIGTGAHARTTTIGNATNNSTTQINAGAGGIVSILTNSGQFNVETTAGPITIGNGASAKTITIGTQTGATSLTEYAGSGGYHLSVLDGQILVESGTGAIFVGTDGFAKTITVGNGTGATSVVINSGTGALSIGANAIAKTTTIGATTTTSTLAEKYGTGGFTLASASGNVIVADSTGRINEPLQPCFSAYKSSTTNSATGDGTVVTVVFDTKLFDQGTNYSVSTGAFTAPVTGNYLLSARVLIINVTLATECEIKIVVAGTSANTYRYRIQKAAGNQQMNPSITQVVHMTATDTANIAVYSSGEAGKTDAIFGNASDFYTLFSGQLIS
jgi:hypothetical protein